MGHPSRSSSDSSSKKKNWNYCNLAIKYLLFLINSVIWLVGIAMLALGIYIQKESSSFESLMLGSVLTNPAIVLIIIGGFLFILGLCGCLGALFELFFLLVIYCALLTLVILMEIGLVVYIYLQRDSALAAFENLTSSAIANYFEDVDLKNIFDSIQSNLLQCCGVRSPNDWQRNPYYNCSSVAFQKCSVPFSCCMLEEGQVINLQCGYRTLDNSTDRFMLGIYTTGCFQSLQNLVQGNLYMVGGVGIGLLIFQVINVILAAGLASDIRKEKKIIKQQKQIKKEQNQELAEL